MSRESLLGTTVVHPSPPTVLFCSVWPLKAKLDARPAEFWASTRK